MQLKVKYLPYHMGQLPWNSNQNGILNMSLKLCKQITSWQFSNIILDYNLTLPPWLCQPMVRAIQKSNLVELETNEEVNKSKTDEKEVRDFIVKQYIY